MTFPSDNNLTNKLIPIMNSLVLEEAVESPIPELPSEVALYVFSYLNFLDRYKASQVCKKWYTFISAWTLLPKVRQLKTITGICESLYISPMGVGRATYQIKQDAVSTPPTADDSSFVTRVEIWDLKREVIAQEALVPESQLTTFIGCNHFVLTKEESTLNISYLSGAVLITFPATEKWSHFSINQHGFICSVNFGTKDLIFRFISIKEDRVPLTEIVEITDCSTTSLLSLLHNDHIIYSIPGALRVRDVTKKGLPWVRDLIAPEIEIALFKGLPQETLSSIMIQNKVFSLLASGSTLVTASLQNILVWDLSTGSVLRTFPTLQEHLDALEGFTLLTHTDKTVTLWDLKEEKITKKAGWKNDFRDNCKNPVGFYNNKVYILSKKGDTGTFTVYDFSKKA